MADIGSLLNTVPPVTRYLLIGVVVVTGPCLLGFLSPALIALSWSRVRTGQAWRPLTNFFFGGGGFPLLYDFFLLYRNSTFLERDVFFGQVDEYAWALTVMAATSIILNVPFGFPFLFRTMLNAVTYLWCRSNPTLKVSIFGLLTIPTSLYPPALVVLDLLTGGPSKAITAILGILAGHFWWFISVYLPVHAPTHLKRKNPLPAPTAFRALFPSQPHNRTSTASGATRITPSASASAASNRSAADAVRHRWGSGQRLGGESL